jgi:Protein of unknown function (DUF433)
VAHSSFLTRISSVELPCLPAPAYPCGCCFDNLADGASLSEILEAFPTLQREQAVEALRQADSLIERSAS